MKKLEHTRNTLKELLLADNVATALVIGLYHGANGKDTADQSDTVIGKLTTRLNDKLIRTVLKFRQLFRLGKPIIDFGIFIIKRHWEHSLEIVFERALV